MRLFFMSCDVTTWRQANFNSVLDNFQTLSFIRAIDLFFQRSQKTIRKSNSTWISPQIIKFATLCNAIRRYHDHWHGKQNHDGKTSTGLRHTRSTRKCSLRFHRSQQGTKCVERDEITHSIIHVKFRFLLCPIPQSKAVMCNLELVTTIITVSVNYFRCSSLGEF